MRAREGLSGNGPDDDGMLRRWLGMLYLDGDGLLLFAWE
jgi:hypothetical protein